MARICMLLTVTPWWDARQLFNQVPAIIDGGHELVFLAGEPDRDVFASLKYIPLSPSRRKRARLTGGLNMLGTILRQHAAAIQLCSVEQLVLGLVLKVFTGMKVVYDCREDTPEAMLRHRGRFSAPVRWSMHFVTRAFEYLADRCLDGIIVSDPALYRMHYAVPQDRLVLFLNTPSLRRFPRDYPPLAERPYDLILLGSQSRLRGILSFIDAIGLLRQRGRRVSAIVVGRIVPEVAVEVDRRIRELGIADQLRITGERPYHEVPSFLRQAKIGIVPLLDTPKFRRNISCKTFEYMACGMPCVCSDLPPQRLFVRHGVNGLFFAPNDAGAMADAIVSLLDAPSRAAAMGEAGRLAVERYWNAERDQEKLRAFYERILGRHGSSSASRPPPRPR